MSERSSQFGSAPLTLRRMLRAIVPILSVLGMVILMLMVVPTVSGQATLRFVPPFAQSSTLPQVGTLDSSTLPALNPQTLSVPTKPHQTKIQAEESAQEDLTLRFTPNTPSPTRTNTSQFSPLNVSTGFARTSVGQKFDFVPEPMPLPLPVNEKEVEQVIQQGLQLETEARWADVLTHYETALRLYRNDTKLMERFRVARFHYDIGRRFHDTSYLEFVHTTNFLDALSLFDEIIARIQSNYVDLPHWDDMFRHGTKDLEIALNDRNFLDQARVTASKQKIQAFLEVFRKTVDGWEIRSREDMRNGILRLAEMGLQQIGLAPVITLMEFVCGVVNALDPYTAYLTPNQLNDQFSMIAGNFVCLGVELKSDRESLVIVRVIQNSPAYEAGLRDGDRIHLINGIATKGRDTDSAADLLQGGEGTSVRLHIQSPDKKARDMHIVRRRIEVPSVEDTRMLTDSLGYARLTGFQSRTCIELRQAIADLERQGMQALVLDLRHNPGGLLQIGVDVANLFIEEGAIVRTRGRQVTMDTPYMATKEHTWKKPLILLIDEESASSSEIVAGAIRDHERGLIVGKRSYGKGTIQAILSVNGGTPGQAKTGLRLTVEKFYSPRGWPYSYVGVTPHVEVETPQRVSLARPLQGTLPVPVLSRTVSSAVDDPFVKRAIELSKTTAYSASKN